MATISKVASLGMGEFGTAVMSILGAKQRPDSDVILQGYDADEEVREGLSRDGKNPKRFQDIDYRLPKNISIADSIEELVEGTDLLIMAMPAQKIRGSLRQIRPLIEERVNYSGNPLIILNVAKALERDTNFLLSEVYRQELIGLETGYRLAALSGGMRAAEIIQGKPAGADIACRDLEVAEYLMHFFAANSFRVYATRDLTGVLAAGALKNYISIVVGIVEGMDGGDNAWALVKSRASKEGRILGLTMGGSSSTFRQWTQSWGADVDLSCKGNTRNYRFGRYVGEGMSMYKALDRLRKEGVETVEGIATIDALYESRDEIEKITGGDHVPLKGRAYRTWRKTSRLLLNRKPLDIPILEETYRVLFEGKDCYEAVKDLMNRTPKRVREY